MKNTKYDNICDKYTVEDDKYRNAFVAFIVGGIVGLIGEGLIEVFCHFNLSRNDAGTLMIVVYIFLSSLCTGLGFFDNLVSFCGCGLLIPILGFAHSITSSCLDYKKEGLIYGIGSNIFRLAGSVILYGVVAAWAFGLIRYFIGGVI